MKMWKDMTDCEKAHLLLAHHKGETMQMAPFGGSWVNTQEPAWMDHHCYRAKPEPVVISYEKYFTDTTYDLLSQRGSAHATHKLTYNKVDGVIDCNSVKLEKL